MDGLHVKVVSWVGWAQASERQTVEMKDMGPQRAQRHVGVLPSIRLGYQNKGSCQVVSTSWHGRGQGRKHSLAVPFSYINADRNSFGTILGYPEWVSSPVSDRQAPVCQSTSSESVSPCARILHRPSNEV